MFNDIPDWARPMTPAELEREAMDHEFNAQYDRWDGWGDPDPVVDHEEYDDDGRLLHWPSLPPREHIDDLHADVPF